MKHILSTETLEIPAGVTVNIKARVITVTGPRGTLVKDLKHIDVSFKKVSEQKLEISIAHGNRKRVAALRTVKSIVANLIVGVTKGFKYKMRQVYAHFRFTVDLEENGTKIIIRNFLGEKRSRELQALEGVTVEISKDVKDELILTGNSVENVSQTAAAINQACLPRNKDIRKFLDGVYVSEKTTVVVDEL